jgi:predicted ATPase
VIKRFNLKNYRHLSCDNEIEFGQINILIGANGSGKSKFIEAVTFLKDIVIEGLGYAVARRDYSEMLNKYSLSENPVISLEWTFNAEKGFNNLRYEIELFVKSREVFALSEILRYEKPADGNSHKSGFSWVEVKEGNAVFSVWNKQNRRYQRISSRLSNKDSVLHQIDTLIRNYRFVRDVSPVFSKVVDDVKEFVSSWQYYPMAKINVWELTEPLRLTGEEKVLLPNALNLGDILLAKRIEFRELLERINDYLGFRDLDFKPEVHSNHVSVIPIINKREFLFGSLSEGQIRILVLMTILFLSDLKVVFIDEPELNLHPSWLYKLRRDFWDSGKQLFIATHSSELLDSFTEDWQEGRVKIFVFENGIIKELKQKEQLKDYLEEGYQLGDLYRSGEPSIGGWPY